MDISSQIKELNEEVKCHIAPSKIAGVGVFALRNILKGEKLNLLPRQARRWYSLSFEELDKLRPEIRQIILDRWPSIINGSLFQNPNDEIWLTSFVNHGGDISNYDISSDSAKRDILANEEITEDYRTMINYEIIYPWLK